MCYFDVYVLWCVQMPHGGRQFVLLSSVRNMVCTGAHGGRQFVLLSSVRNMVCTGAPRRAPVCMCYIQVYVLWCVQVPHVGRQVVCYFEVYVM